MRLVLPYPPSSNRYWRHFRGRVVTSAPARAYKVQVAAICAQAGVTPLQGPVRVALDFYRPARRGDLDNNIKVLLDALNGHAFADDGQIVEIHARRFEDRRAPRLEVTWENIDAPE